MLGKTDFDLFNKEHATDAYNDEIKIIKTGKPVLDKEEKLDNIKLPKESINFT